MSTACMVFLPQKEGQLERNEQDCEGSFDVPTVWATVPRYGVNHGSRCFSEDTV